MTVPEPRARARVLIIDDTSENIHILLRTLSGICDVVAATTADKGLNLARSRRPDLILLDVVMPDMSGYEVCRLMKEDPQTASIPVIFVTALGESGEEKRGLDLGAVDYITKPFHPDLVRARVLNQLELKRHRDHLEEEVDRRTQALLEARSREQKLESELEVASQLQLSLLPPGSCSDPRLGRWGLAAHLHPARQVGGDLYDYFFIGDQQLMFALGDVSDKGVPAALFMVRVRTLLRLLGRTVHDPARLLVELNDSLCDDNDAGMFVTLVCGIVNLHTGSMSLASAGHEAPMLMSAGENARLEEWNGGGALGLWKGQEFEKHQLQLEPGQTIALYTDGVTEAQSEADELFGTERLLEESVPAPDESASDLLQQLLASLERFVGQREPFDDVAMLLLQRPAEVSTGHTLTDAAELDTLQESLQTSLRAWDCCAETIHDLQLIAEELALNSLGHGGEGQLTLEVSWRMLDGSVEVRFSDNGVAFDPLEAGPKQNEEEAGGWGIPLVRALSDHLSYRREDDRNVVTVQRRRREPVSSS